MAGHRRNLVVLAGVLLLGAVGTIAPGATAAAATAPPPLVMPQTVVDLGPVGDGYDAPVHQQVRLPVLNQSDAPVTVTGNVYQGRFTPVVVSTDCIGVTLAPGGTCDVIVDYSVDRTAPAPSAAETADGARPTLTLNGRRFRIVPFLSTFSTMQLTPTTLVPAGVYVGDRSTGYATLTNTGTRSRTVTAQTALAAPLSVTGSCVGTLAPGASCRVGVVYTPTAAGSVQAQTLTFTVDGEQVTLFVNQYDYNVEPAGLDPFLVTPTGLDFGDVPVGTRSDPQAVTVTNVSTTTRTVTGTAPRPGPLFVATQTCEGVTLAPGESCRMSFRFAPTAARAVSTEVTGTWRPTPWSVTLRGTGVTGAVTRPLRISPTALEYGALRSGQSRAETVTVTNQTTDPLTLTGQVVVPTVLAASGSCHDGLVLAAGASCTMTYTVTVGDANYIIEDPVVGTWNGQQFRITTSAPESMRLIRTDVVGLDFGNGSATGARPAQVATITNRGFAPLDLTSAQFATSGRATVVSDTCVGAVLPTDGSCQVRIGWRRSVPTTGPEPVDRGVVVLDRGDVSLTAVEVVGTSTAPSHVLTPSVDFGVVPLGTSRSVSLPVRNMTTTNNPVAATTLGPLPPGVTRSTTCDGSVVPAGDDCAVVLTWHPTRDHPRLTGTVTVRLDGAYPNPVTVRGAS